MDMSLDLQPFYICVFVFSTLIILVCPDSTLASFELLDSKHLIPKYAYLPTFLPTPANVTVAKGEEAKLQCAVENRGTKTIVWRKASDPNPITIGDRTFIGDSRFKVKHSRHSLAWNLHIMDARPEDSGVYECQVVIKAPDIRQLVMLTVDESLEYKNYQRRISIHGSFFVERGDLLRLVCNATGADYPPDDLDWFKDGNKIKNSDRISLSKDVSLAERMIISILQIRRGNIGDAGTYVCRASDLQVTSAKVNILNTGTNNEKRESDDATKEGQGYHTGNKNHHNNHNNRSYSIHRSDCYHTILLYLIFFISFINR